MQVINGLENASGSHMYSMKSKFIALGFQSPAFLF